MVRYNTLILEIKLIFWNTLHIVESAAHVLHVQYHVISYLIIPHIMYNFLKQSMHINGIWSSGNNICSFKVIGNF